ncbi:MAG TPA: FHA domain-containing serine/threonine-protein kinase [Anaeromyxobacter sp.]|nr:FHA domain-containing serine/threonine-protein kinase [Anaeromyxobacter sp.]
MNRSVPGYPRALVVLVHDAGGVTRHAYLRSPVRIGCDPQCELLLEAPEAGERHGLVQFDEREVWYTDLGSDGGTAAGGVRLGANTPVRLDAGVALDIGPVRLTFERGTLPGASLASIRPGTVSGILREMARAPDAPRDDAWAAPLHPGLAIGRFELVRELGRGGFGVVYEARDGKLGRPVAFKALRPLSALEAGLGTEFLEREAEAAAQLSHPHIVRLLDAGSWAGGPYVIYELLRGEGLEARLARGSLEPDRALEIAVEVARALAHAHEAGVVHRDIKPSNVFLTEEGWAKVLDFGLAHVLGASRQLPGGTPRYMAPEQFGRSAPDARVDVFAAALVLREAWLGPGLDDAGLRAPGPLPGAPRSLDDLLRRALAEDPAGRPADGRAWLAGLLEAQRDRARPGTAEGGR